MINLCQEAYRIAGAEAVKSRGSRSHAGQRRIGQSNKRQQKPDMRKLELV